MNEYSACVRTAPAPPGHPPGHLNKQSRDALINLEHAPLSVCSSAPLSLRALATEVMPKNKGPIKLCRPEGAPQLPALPGTEEGPRREARVLHGELCTLARQACPGPPHQWHRPAHRPRRARAEELRQAPPRLLRQAVRRPPRSPQSVGSVRTNNNNNIDDLLLLLLPERVDVHRRGLILIALAHGPTLVRSALHNRAFPLA